MADKSNGTNYGAANGRNEGFALPVAFNFEQLMELNRPALTAMAEVNGKVYENLMVDVQATNQKLVERATRIVQEAAGVSRGEAEAAIRVERLIEPHVGQHRAAVAQEYGFSDVDGKQPRPITVSEA